MKALTIIPGKANSASVQDVPEPSPEYGSILVDALELGICGEHGGDPDSIHFFHAAGLDYVSCSPFRLPIARVAAAQAAIAEPRPQEPRDGRH